MRLLLLNDTFDLENWGAQAGVDGLKNLIKELFPEDSIKSLSYKWIAKKYFISNKFLGSKVHSGSNTIINRFSKNYQFLPLMVDEYEYIAKLWLDGNGGPQAKEFIELMPSVDYIILNAEGSVYRNNYTAIKELFLLWFAKNYFEKPCFFINGSVSINYVDPILPAMINKTFTTINGIAVREPFSYRNVKNFYPDINLKIIPDTAFYFSGYPINKLSDKYLSIKKKLRDERYSCISLPILLTKIPNYSRQPDEYSPVINLIKEIKKITPNVIVLCKEPNEYFLKEIAIRTESIFFGPEYTYFDLLDLLKNSQFLISGRYHHIIFATIMGCPFIPLTSSSHKIHGLCELFNDVINLPPVDSTDLFSNFQKILEKASEFSNSNEDFRNKLKQQALKLKNDLSAIHQLIIDGLN